MNIDENIIIGTTEWFNENFPGRSEQDKKMEIGDCSVENPLTILLYGNGLSVRYWESFKNEKISEMVVVLLGMILKSNKNSGNIVFIRIIETLKAIVQKYSTISFENTFDALNTFINMSTIINNTISEDNAREEIDFVNSINVKLYRSLLTLMFGSSILLCSYESSKNTHKNIRSLICNFDRVFTLCYDPLIYWSLINNKNTKQSICDLFYGDSLSINMYKDWENTCTRTILYNLHGSVWHYLNEQNKYCIQTGEPDDKKMKEITNKLQNESMQKISNNLPGSMNLDNNRITSYIDCVMEGSSEKKLLQIKKNTYLQHCYKIFDKIITNNIPTKILLIGVGLTEKDNHIVDIIKNAKNADIYITFLEGTRISDEYYNIWKHCKTSNDGSNIHFVKIGYNHGLPCDYYSTAGQAST
ncbi:MAG: DUF4917 family protein [Caldisericia bacterium]|nr:DUF4917 family protein [Caldisericia bacterium]